ncbi:MAG: alpha-L-rhamnosidase N-terminal domain-containing protein, partial [Candidatus Latescibacteria bacterium]|nr:alpha-L-rhamnosidase N-terminal domain-containing protein [Candidatus Latescibacterota bacterium]
MFRKEFTVDKDVMCARLYVSGLGYYEAYLNGRRIGDYVLDPGWTDYRDRVFYSTFDVTPFLQKDLNCIGVMVGNGWYNPLPMRMWGRLNLRDHLSTGRPRFIAQLNIEFTGGSAQSIASSTDWRVHEGPVVRNNIYLGEVYDARSEIQGWSNPGLDDSQWCQAALSSDKIGPLQAQPQPPLKITAEVKPVEIMEPQPGIFIF